MSPSIEGWELSHERQRELLARDGLMCEQHPGVAWPHGECAGPGMPWMIEGRERVLALMGPLPPRLGHE